MAAPEDEMTKRLMQIMAIERDLVEMAISLTLSDQGWTGVLMKIDRDGIVVNILGTYSYQVTPVDALAALEEQIVRRE